MDEIIGGNLYHYLGDIGQGRDRGKERKRESVCVCERRGDIERK